MKKIKLVICTGTTCYVMGNAQLLTIREELNKDILPYLEIEGSTCLKYCKDESYGNAPFVMINDKIFSGASLPEIKSEIERLYTNIKGDD